jgi:hypothetical protein
MKNYRINNVVIRFLRLKKVEVFNFLISNWFYNS